MGITFEQLEPPRWGGPVPDRVERKPMVLGEGTSRELVVDPPVVLSPMAAVTNAPFRLLCREMGAGLVVTEMVSAVGLVHRAPTALQMVDLRPEEFPVSVQIFGKDPVAMAEAACVVQEMGAHAVDVNMGCPMKKVVSSGHGAALLRQPKLVYEIFKAMVDAVDIPVTGKTRAGWEGTDVLDVARAMEDAGAAAITIHGRTRCAMYNGHVDLAVISMLKQATRMKVIGNGDVADVASARRMFAITDCDAVMVARGCLGNPWVFRELAADLHGQPVPERPGFLEKAGVLRRHAALYVATFGEHRATRELRKHLLWYFRHTAGEHVLRRALQDIESVAAIEDAIQRACEACEAEEQAA